MAGDHPDPLIQHVGPQTITFSAGGNLDRCNQSLSNHSLKQSSSEHPDNAPPSIELIVRWYCPWLAYRDKTAINECLCHVFTSRNGSQKEDGTNRRQQSDSQLTDYVAIRHWLLADPQ